MMKNYIRKDQMVLEGMRYRGVHIELTKKDAFVECMKALYDDLNNKGRENPWKKYRKET